MTRLGRRHGARYTAVSQDFTNPEKSQLLLFPPHIFSALSTPVDTHTVYCGHIDPRAGVVVDKGKGWYKVRVPGVDSLTNLRGSDLSVVQPSPSPAAKKSPPLPCVGDSPAASPAAVAAARVVGSPARGVTNRVETVRVGAQETVVLLWIQ